MAQQGELFPSPEVAVKLDRSRHEPRLWVRRLVIWEKPGQIIREIRLRRGLNIVWSPDPGAAFADLGRDAGSGHGAGKTLFCRFLRYCLGELTFATNEQRQRIMESLPAGLVGAEVMLQGQPWAVIRPIGQTRKHLARENTTLEELAESKEPASGIQPLLDALGRIFPEGIEAYLPGGKESAVWPYALAWLSRDQECRFDRILDWRHRTADTGSVALAPPKDQLLVVVRAFFGVIEQQELQLKSERERLSETKRSLERDMAYYQRRTEQVGAEFVKVFELESDPTSSGEFAFAAFQEKAISKLREIEQQDAAHRSSEPLAHAQREREGVLGEIAVVHQEVEKLKALEVLHQEQLRKLRGERSNLDAAEIEALLGPVCPVCRVPIDQALAEGCDLSNVFRDPASIADEKRGVVEQMAACNEAVLRSQRLTSAQQTRLQQLSRQERALVATIAASRKDIEESNRQRRQQWFNAQQLVEKIAEQQSTHDNIARSVRSLEDLSRDDERLSNLQAQLRNQHSDTLSRLGDLFSYVCRGLLGNHVTASLTLTGKGLDAEVEVGGMAMESLKAIAFDLAALLLTIEGRTALPAFLIHDSPREADLGENHYHRLFRLVQRLEDLSDDPPFQYVITTTSRPPEDLCRLPFLVAQLRGSDIGERLLRRNLG